MKRFTWESTPLFNILQWDDEGYLDESREMGLSLRPPVGSLQQRLGRQAFTWNGEFRFWIWEGPDWRVFASNRQGISFEVREGSSREAGLAAWQDFRKKAGLR